MTGNRASFAGPSAVVFGGLTVFNLVKDLPTHSSRLERWLGAETLERLSRSMLEWYGPPIALSGVPGNVYATRGGDFHGRILEGGFVSGVDRAVMSLQKRGYIDAVGRLAASPRMGFSSLSDMIAEQTAGKGRSFWYQKVGATGVVGVTNSLWGLGNLPAAGANATGAPNGDAPTDATQGAYGFVNPSSPDTQHFTTAFAMANYVNTLMLYDRIFQVNKTMASTVAESVTGVPTRYQGSVGAANSPEGNFCFPEVGGTALAATAHNHLTCRYRNQAGTDTISFPSVAGVSSAIVRRLDLAAYLWFMPLATNDTGVKDLDQIQLDASVATGVLNYVIGHPLAFIPIPIVNLMCIVDGINTAFNLVQIFDDAALALLEISKPATNATTYQVEIDTVAG